MIVARSGGTRARAPEAHLPLPAPCSPVLLSLPTSQASFLSQKKRRPQLNRSSSLCSPGRCHGVGERAASPSAMPCGPSRQTGTVPGADMTSSHLLSRLPVGFPRKKDKVSMCWDTLNKQVFKIEPPSPLVSLQVAVIQPTAPCLFCTLRGPSLLRGKQSLSSTSAPPCDAGGVATSTTRAARLLPSAPHRNPAGVPGSSPKRNKFSRVASATDGSTC